MQRVPRMKVVSIPVILEICFENMIELSLIILDWETLEVMVSLLKYFSMILEYIILEVLKVFFIA